MSKIKAALSSGKAFIPFITCGDPDLETTEAAVIEAEKNGAAMVVLGIPFCDPTAEVPVIQASNIRALKGGVKTADILSLVKKIRAKTSIPMVFFAYANVVFSYGSEKFISACGEAGVDGLFVEDLPFEEKEEFLPFCEKYGVDLISAVAPTSGDRIPMIAENAEGFLFVSADIGETDRRILHSGLEETVRTARKYTDIPCVVAGQSLSNMNSERLTEISDGVVVDSAIVERLESYGKNAPKEIGLFIKELSTIH